MGLRTLSVTTPSNHKFSDIRSMCNHIAPHVDRYSDEMRDNAFRGDDIQSRICVHTSAVGRSILHYAILSLVSDWSPPCDTFRDTFASYIREGFFLMRDFWVTAADMSTTSLTSTLETMVTEGIIRKGGLEPVQPQDESVLVFCKPITNGDGARYLLTDLGSAQWLQFEDCALDGQYCVSGWSPSGSVIVSRKPLSYCPSSSELGTDHCPLYCSEKNDKDRPCYVGFIPKWKASWWRPVTPGYALFCSRTADNDLSKYLGDLTLQ